MEAQRIEERTKNDVEMLREAGYCNGIENYSRYFSGRAPGSEPYTLLSFLPKDFLLFVDESHISVPQIRGMFNGDHQRKQTLIDYGFRLPSALDNRPLMFDEFMRYVQQAVFVSATPSDYEYQVSTQVAQQLLRPTGLVDPLIEVRPSKDQVPNLIGEIRQRVEKQERVLVTRMTKKSSELLADYLQQEGIKAQYLHSDLDALARVHILRQLRSGDIDVLVGINLLREGLDLPEVSLVAILDADKEGFLRSETSLLQTMGRAARNVSGTIIMYADEVTGPMSRAMAESRRRREDPAGVQQGARHHAPDDPQGHLRAHRPAVAQAGRGREAGKGDAREDVADRSAGSGHPAQRGDAGARRVSGVRGSRQAARQDRPAACTAHWREASQTTGAGPYASYGQAQEPLSPAFVARTVREDAGSPCCALDSGAGGSMGRLQERTGTTQ